MNFVLVSAANLCSALIDILNFQSFIFVCIDCRLFACCSNLQYKCWTCWKLCKLQSTRRTWSRSRRTSRTWTSWGLLCKTFISKEKGKTNLNKIPNFKAPAHYKYGYAVKDPHTGDHKEAWESRDGDAVKGSYSLLDSDGTKRVVDYTADKHQGFSAVVKTIGHGHEHVEHYPNHGY